MGRGLPLGSVRLHRKRQEKNSHEGFRDLANVFKPAQHPPPINRCESLLDDEPVLAGIGSGHSLDKEEENWRICPCFAQVSSPKAILSNIYAVDIHVLTQHRLDSVDARRLRRLAVNRQTLRADRIIFC